MSIVLAGVTLFALSLAAPAPGETEAVPVDLPAAASEAGAEDAEAAEPAADDAAEGPTSTAEPALKFNFRYQPWKDVLDWFADQADLSLLMDAPPPGTLNYTDSRSYSPAEALDLMNSVLLTKGYTLVRRERMLHIVNLEDGIPPNLVPRAELEDLDDRGEFELISVLFSLEKLTPDEAEPEIKKLLGPQGSVVILSKSRQLLVTETGGRLRTIRSVLDRIEHPQALPPGNLKVFELEHATTDEVMPVLRQLLDIPAEGTATADGSLRIAADPLGGRLLATGKPDMLVRITDILKVVDVPLATDDSGAPAVAEQLQLETYSVTGSDATLVLQILQTLLVGRPGVRLSTDPKSGALVALARPSEHATIRATIDQLQRDAGQVTAIRLRVVAPETAVQSISKLYGAPDAGGPKVEADLAGRQILIRGSRDQLEQVRQLLWKMGETSLADADAPRTDGGRVRVIPLSPAASQNVLDQLQELWPSLRPNKIRVVTPSAVIPSLKPGEPSDEEAPPPSRLRLRPKPADEQEREAPDEPGVESTPREDTGASHDRPRRQIRAQFVSDPLEDEAAGAASESPESPADASPTDEAPPIVVAIGPTGIVIACEDEEALTACEDLLWKIVSQSAAGATDYTIFYLIHASATSVTETLGRILGGTTSSPSTTEQPAANPNPFGGAAAATPAAEAPVIVSKGSLLVVPDERLNALIVQGTPLDLVTIERLLEVLDQRDGPETAVTPRPGMIPVFNTSATEIAAIVRDVYQDRLAGGASGGGQQQNQQQPNPADFFQMFRNQQRNSNNSGGRRGADQQQTKMTIGVDTRTNSLVVAAPAPLFEEVRQLVEQLDEAAPATAKATRVIAVSKLNPQAVQQALAAMTGNKVKTNGQQPGAATTSGGQPTSQTQGQGAAAQGEDAVRQQYEEFRRRQGGGDRRRNRGDGSGQGGGGGGGQVRQQ